MSFQTHKILVNLQYKILQETWEMSIPFYLSNWKSFITVAMFEFLFVQAVF